MDERTKRLRTAEAAVARLVIEAQRRHSLTDLRTAEVPDRLLIEPSALISAARQLRLEFLTASSSAVASVDSLSPHGGILLGHVREHLLKTSWSLAQICQAVNAHDAGDFLEFCALQDESFDRAMRAQRKGAFGGAAVSDLALATQQRLSAIRAMMKLQVALFPSRLSNEELKTEVWHTEIAPPGPSGRFANINVLFEAPIELYWPRVPPVDPSLQRVAAFAAQAVSAQRIEAPYGRMSVLLNGLILHGPRAAGYQPEATLMLSISHPEQSQTPRNGPLVETMLVNVGDQSALATIAANVEMVLAHGSWEVVSEGLLNGVRLTDRSAMELGRAMTGPAPLYNFAF